ncbi:hypothetical protein [Nocardioides sp.]|uniref:hypothetical protein n=1 Tax=Nocardioides sp. TaxID=35761 RepID=UPI002B27250C|nr:hypothetical protein [Nocardioides sp.]
MSDETLSVTGGAAGIEAGYTDISLLATLLDEAGDDLRHDAWHDKALALNADLLESSILSPRTFVEAEGAVVAATVGPKGLALRAVGLEADALSIQVAVALLRGSDELTMQAMEALDYSLGHLLGGALPFLGLAGLAGGTTLLLSNPALAAYLAAHPELADEALADVQGFLEDHPDLVQHLLNGGGGLMDGLLGTLPPAVRTALLLEVGLAPFHGTTNDAAGDLAGLFGDTDVVVRPGEGPAPDFDAPGSLEDLLQDLGETNRGVDGRIDIQVVGEGDQARYIVHLPGTDSWGDDPGDARDLTANLQLVSGQDTAYTRGITEAMAAADIPPGAPVMLVGHSQGGMAAAHLAADAGFQSTYDVRHVVTAGAPTAQVGHVASGTQVLSLENSGDLVPLTDGEDNPDQPNRTTVVFDGRTGSIGENHSMDTYRAGGAAVDASDDPSIGHVLGSMRDDGFLGGNSRVQTQSFVITRDTP